MAKKPEYKQEKQYCNKFNKRLKTGAYQKKMKSFKSFITKMYLWLNLGFSGGSAVKNPPAMQEMEHPQEEGTAAHSSIFGWRIPPTEEPGGLQSLGLQRVGHDSGTKQ